MRTCDKCEGKGVVESELRDPILHTTKTITVKCAECTGWGHLDAVWPDDFKDKDRAHVDGYSNSSGAW